MLFREFITKGTIFFMKPVNASSISGIFQIDPEAFYNSNIAVLLIKRSLTLRVGFMLSFTDCEIR